MTVLVLYLAALGPCEGENERNNRRACVCASGDSTLCSPVDTPTNGNGAGEGGGSGKSNTVLLKPSNACLTTTVHNFIRMKETLHARGSLRWCVYYYFVAQIA